MFSELEMQSILKSLQLRFNAIGVECTRAFPAMKGYERYRVRLWMHTHSYYETWAEIDPLLPASELETIFAESIQRAVVEKIDN